MSTPRILRPVTVAVLALSLGACGKLGPLEQPPPLFGAQAKADYAAQQAAKEAAKTAKLAERAAVKKKPEVAAIKAAPTQRAVTLRVYWSAVVTDETAAIDSYKDHPTVRKAALAAALQVANEAARTSKDEAAAPLGFRFIKEERAQ